jgi:hypothetical protein
MFARAFFGAVIVAVIGMSSTAQAQTVDGAIPSLKTTVTNAFLSARAAEEQLAAPGSLARPTPATFDAPSRGDMTLRSLYATTATMQMLDVHSTVKALGRGAVEANPLMSGIVQHRAAFVAAKAGLAAVTIYATRRMARNNKVGAIATMIAMNSAYAMIVANNYRIAHR